MSYHAVVPLQSHPFTIASLPCDGKLKFHVQAKQGGTKRFFDQASKYEQLPVSEDQSVASTKLAALEGPYGRMRPLHQFDSIVLFAGRSGATFTVPLLRDIAHRWRTAEVDTVATRRVRFVWAVKSRDQLSWLNEQLDKVMADSQELQDREV